jgi:glycosyltransferase involved in cell wall biosynthesis
MISAVVLAHNDADVITGCLSMLAWCDEIIVIDDYSQDDTAVRAGKAGAIVVKRHLDNDFASQRNFGIDQAKGEWILFVDSDEIVPPPLAREISEVVRETGKNGFMIGRRDAMFGKILRYGETAGVRLLRLARKGSGRFTRPVHETWTVSGPVGALRNVLLHYPHQTVGGFLDEINSYSGINATYLRGQGVRVAWWHIPVYPLAKFVKNHIIRLGFLDGMPGLVVSVLMSFHSFLTRAKLYQESKPS